MSLPEPSEVVAALDAAYSGIAAAVGGLSDRDLLLPSGCHGWTLSDLLLHVTSDARRALVALHTPADGPPDVDFVSYWRAFPAANGSNGSSGSKADDGSSGSGAEAAAELSELAEDVQWIRRSAAAYERPSDVAKVWAVTAPAAVHAARTADPAGLIGTQGHVLAVPDFLATLIAEAVLHHLDLTTPLPDPASPDPAAVMITLSMLEGLAGPAGLPAHWSPLEALRKATGRAPLDISDARFPLIG